MQKIYYTTNMHGEFIAIKHDETGYYKTDFESQDHINALNELLENSPAEIKAAECCSMFDRWSKFDDMVKTFKEKGIS